MNGMKSSGSGGCLTGGESSDSFVASAAVSIASGWSEPVPGRELHPLKSSAFHGALFHQLTNRLSLKYQRPAVERAKPFCLVRPEFRRLDSRKTPTLFAGMGSANKYPWTDRQPADANSWR